MRQWIILSWLSLIVFCGSLIAQTGSHGGGGAVRSGGRPTVQADADAQSLRLFERIRSLVELFDEMKAAGTPFANPELERLLRLLMDRFQNAESADALLPGAKMNAADQTVWFDNLDLLVEYAAEILGLQSADNLTPAVALQETAADNLEKKWRIFGRSRRQNWAVASPESALLTAFGRGEARRRETLVASGNGAALRAFINELTTRLAPPSAGNPVTELRSTLDDVVGGLKNTVDEKKQDVDQLVRDYEALRKSYQKWVNENIRGKTAEQLSKSVLDEARRRSAELRRLEATLQRLVGDIPADLRDAIDRFKRNPRKFVEEESDLFLKRLRERDPRKADQLEQLVNRYKQHLANLDSLLERYRGKTAEQIGREGLDALRRESQAVRNLEQTLKDGLEDLEQAYERARRDFEQKGKDLRRRLEGDINEFKHNDLNRIEGHIKGKIDEVRNQVEKDLRDLKSILDR